MAMLADAEGRTAPARVYPASGEAEAWIVEPPAPGGVAGADARRTFTGAAALLNALEYAHVAYGSATFLSR